MFKSIVNNDEPITCPEMLSRKTLYKGGLKCTYGLLYIHKIAVQVTVYEEHAILTDPKLVLQLLSVRNFFSPTLCRKF